jgi:hypothetical protein
MAKKAKNKKKVKKPALKRTSKKMVKKPIKKKKSSKKKISKKKAASKKKALKKKTSKKKTATKSRAAARQTAMTKPTVVESGSTGVVAKPIEAGLQEEAVGTVTHYYSHLNVAVIQLNTGILKTGSTIHIKGATTDFTQIVESMEFEHQPIVQAVAGQSFGLRVKEHAREHDIVFLVK